MDEKKRIPVAEADGWIPVQEGLPKKSDYYLVTRGRKRITTMLYFTRGKWWSDSLCQDRWPDYMILAWQPRPKPYMGGADEFIPSISVDDAIEALREVKTAMQHYTSIMNKVWNTDVSADKDFQREFNHFYRIRRNEEWRKKFYRIFEDTKQKTAPNFAEVLEELYAQTGNVEASFASKMVATLNPNKPIWDSMVLSVLLMKPETKNGKATVSSVISCYNDIDRWYYDFKKHPTAKEWIRKFDKAFPEYKDISATKKIDFILWAGGEARIKTKRELACGSKDCAAAENEQN